MNESALGFTHFLAQADHVARFILVAMLLASLVSLGIIVDRLLGHWLLRRRSTAFLARFRRARSFAEVADGLSEAPDEPCARLARIALDSTRHYAAHDASHLDAAGGLSEFLTRALRQGIEEESERLERGLTLLASVGSTAPFVGLFGTVWGIMSSFQAIAASKNTSLAVVAPGIAEALFATAIGLIAAIPATIFYNKFTAEVNRQAQRLEGFADEFSAILSRQIDERA